MPMQCSRDFVPFNCADQRFDAALAVPTQAQNFSCDAHDRSPENSNTAECVGQWYEVESFNSHSETTMPIPPVRIWVSAILIFLRENLLSLYDFVREPGGTSQPLRVGCCS